MHSSDSSGKVPFWVSLKALHTWARFPSTSWAREEDDFLLSATWQHFSKLLCYDGLFTFVLSCGPQMTIKNWLDGCALICIFFQARGRRDNDLNPQNFPSLVARLPGSLRSVPSAAGSSNQLSKLLYRAANINIHLKVGKCWFLIFF